MKSKRQSISPKSFKRSISNLRIQPHSMNKDAEDKKKDILHSEASRKHFKSLTSFINAYHIKMTHSNSAHAKAAAATGRGSLIAEGARMTQKEINNETQILNADVQKPTVVGRKNVAKVEAPNEIKFDYEEFMKIYNFEKNVKGGGNFKDEFARSRETQV